MYVCIYNITWLILLKQSFKSIMHYSYDSRIIHACTHTSSTQKLQSLHKSPKKTEDCIAPLDQVSKRIKFGRVGGINQKIWEEERSRSPRTHEACSPWELLMIFSTPFLIHYSLFLFYLSRKGISQKTTHLSATQYMIPHTWSSKIDVKIRVAPCHAHKTILLYLLDDVHSVWKRKGAQEWIDSIWYKVLCHINLYIYIYIID